MATIPVHSRRVWLSGGAAAGAVIAAAAWFLLISPQLSSADDLHAQAADQRAQNVQLEQRVAVLKTKKAHLSTYTEQLGAALAALPTDSGLPAFTRQVDTQAADAGVRVSSIDVGGIKSAAAPTVSTPAAESGAESTDQTATTPSTTSGTTVASGTYAISVTVISNGSLAHQTAFLDALRRGGPRFALVSSVQLTPGLGDRVGSLDSGSSMTTQLTVFSAPQTPAQVTQLKKLLRGDIGG